MTKRILVDEAQLGAIVQQLSQRPPDTSGLEAAHGGPLAGTYQFASLTKDGWTLRVHTSSSTAAEVVLVIEDWHRGNTKRAKWVDQVDRTRLLNTGV